jgi:hypothetical protein
MDDSIIAATGLIATIVIVIADVIIAASTLLTDALSERTALRQSGIQTANIPSSAS